MYGYIYLTTNKVNGKIYVGQKHANKFLGNKYLGSGKVLKQALQEYGRESFDVTMLESVELQQDMDERERYWIAKYDATNRDVGYNICDGGRVNRDMVGEHNPFYNKHHTPEAKQKMQDAHKNRTNYHKHTEEEKLKLSRAMLGRKCTWGAKLSLNAQTNSNYGMRNKSVSNQTKAKLSHSAVDRWNRDGERAKQSASVKNLWEDGEYREKHIEAMIGKHHTITYKDCPICGRTISSSNFKRHYDKHEIRG